MVEGKERHLLFYHTCRLLQKAMCMSNRMRGKRRGTILVIVKFPLGEIF